MNTFLDRNPSLKKVFFSPDQKEQLLEIFPRYGVRNVHKYVLQNSTCYLPFIDCEHVYLTDMAQSYFEFCKTDVFHFIASSLVINVHELTRRGRSWATGREREKAKKKIKKLLGDIPVSVFVKVIQEESLGAPIVFTLLCMPTTWNLRRTFKPVDLCLPLCVLRMLCLRFSSYAIGTVPSKHPIF